MIDSTLILFFGFGLGILHALDADHVMAVSGLASSRPGLKSSISFCLRWAIGHGLILLSVAMVVYVLDMAIPVQMSSLAENLIGFVLIIIGLLVLFDLYKRKAHLSFHHHQGMPAHIHWHVPHNESGQNNMRSTHHEHRAVLVGMLHGMAGSAPLLAIIPVTQSDNAWMALFYVLLFSVGVISSMMLCGGLLGIVFKRVSAYGHNVLFALRSMIAFSAITFGVLLLKGAM